METQCAKSTQGGEHRLDPVEFRQYETDYVCLDCGGFFTQYGNAGC